MTKKKNKPPSRQRYEKENPTISFRLDKESHQRLKKHLRQSGCSVTDFVKDALGREESMVDARIEKIVKQKAPASVEEKLRILEDMVYQFALNFDNNSEPVLCPRCNSDQELKVAWAYQKGSSDVIDFIPLLKCPTCGYYTDTYKGINPETIRWDSEAAERTLNPLLSRGKPKSQRKNRGKK
jgi:hypothetical protein